jgi:thymidylate kinase
LDSVATVDSLIDERAVVFGSLPPAGRDLDLLLRPAAEAALVAGLPQKGFVSKRGIWARFGACTVEIIEAVPAASWRLPAGELSALFEQAIPLEGYRHLVRPAPHHRLLVLAVKVARQGAHLDGNRLQRLEEALAEDPAAWDEAARRAPLWHADDDLAGLRQTWEATARQHAASGKRSTRAGRRRTPRRALRRLARLWRRRGTLITLSGLDGCGKSSQAEHLREALERLGHDAEVVWTSIASHPEALNRLKRRLNAAIGLVFRDRRGQPADGAPDRNVEDRAKALRRRSRLLTFAWSTVIAVINARRQSRATRRHLWRGRVVVCDRFTLDSVVHMRYAYGEHRSFGLQEALIRALSPRPQRSYFLDVAAEVASARKPDYPVEENATRARLYREECRRLGAVVLDGERPREDLCAEIGSDVWGLLPKL